MLLKNNDEMLFRPGRDQYPFHYLVIVVALDKFWKDFAAS